MDQSESSSPPPPPRRSGPRPTTHVVRIEARSGGMWRAITFIFGLLLIGGIFLVGIGIGAAGAMAAKGVERMVIEQTYRDGARRDRIAILPIEGVIMDLRAEFVHKAVDQILDDQTIRAVVLRVDSPGGGVTASDHIWYQVKRLKSAQIPVVASYGSVAASGGYYASCHADYIIAEETSITGSIGVIAQIFTMEGLMGKIGIEPVTLVASSSPEKDTANNLFREWEERDRQRVLRMLDSAYEIFRDRVRAGRGTIITSENDLDTVANGAIFTTAEAIDKGLVDSTGYLEDAIAKAEQLANLRAGSARVIRYADPPKLFGGMLFSGPSPSSRTLSNMSAEEMRAFVTELTSPRIMFLMP